MTDMQQLLLGANQLTESVRISEAQATDAERQAQATQQELARSQQAGAKGKGKAAAPPQQEQGIGAFASKYQPRQFDGEDDKWQEWARVFRNWAGRFFGGAPAEDNERVEGHRNEPAAINDLTHTAQRFETGLVRNIATGLYHVLIMPTR